MKGEYEKVSAVEVTDDARSNVTQINTITTINTATPSLELAAIPEKEYAKLEEYNHVQIQEEIPPELQALLHTDPKTGLSNREASKRRKKFGRNELVEVKRNPF